MPTGVTLVMMTRDVNRYVVTKFFRKTRGTSAKLPPRMSPTTMSLYEWFAATALQQQ